MGDASLVIDLFFLFLFIIIFLIFQFYILIKNSNLKNKSIYFLNKLSYLSLLAPTYGIFLLGVYLIVLVVYISTNYFKEKNIKNTLIQLCLMGDIFVYAILFFGFIFWSYLF